MKTGNLIEMGQIITVDDDGTQHTHPRALLITFDTEQACRDAIIAERCAFTFGDPEPTKDEREALEARGQQRIDGL